jgi:hypothetical protein
LVLGLSDNFLPFVIPIPEIRSEVPENVETTEFF